MRGSREGTVVDSVQVLFGSGTAGGAPDAELLEGIACGRPGADSAFEALLERHGSMVWAVCRGLIVDRSLAEDAFQATFLALIQRRDSIRLRGSLAPWLFSVARRVARRSLARSNRLKSLTQEKNAEPVAPHNPAESAERSEIRGSVLDEIGKLPDRYRLPILLCYFEGYSSDQAADELGWPVGTVRGRLSRARRLLGDRLERRGLSLSVGAVISLVQLESAKAVPASLAASLRSFALTACRTSTVASGAVPAALLALAESGVSTVASTSIKFAVAGLVMAGTVALGMVMTASAQFGGGEGLGASAPEQPKGVQFERGGLGGGSLPSRPASSVSAGADVTLNEALRRIEKAGNVKIVAELDTIDELNRPLGSPISVGGVESVEGVKVALRYAIRGSSNLAYRFENDNLVVIETREQARINELQNEIDRLKSELEESQNPGGQPPPADLNDAQVGINDPSNPDSILQPVEEANDQFLTETIAAVEAKFIEKASEAIEIQAVIDAWKRVEALDLHTENETSETSTELSLFIRQIKERMVARLEDFSGSFEEAESGLAQLRKELKGLTAIHVALVGDQSESHAQLRISLLVAKGLIMDNRFGLGGGLGGLSSVVLTGKSGESQVNALFDALGISPPMPFSTNGGLQ